MPPTQALGPLTARLSALRLPSTAARSFTTTPALGIKTIKANKIPPPLAPAYPPGERTLYKQSNSGLYGKARIAFGSRAAGKQNVRSPRLWKPNVHQKKLWSESLGAWVQTRLTTRVMRTIKKEGGLDEYLVAHGRRRVDELGPAGWRLRWLVMQTESMQARFRAEREKLGVKAREEGEDDGVLRGEKIQIALDYATPGPLSRSTRDILEKRREMLSEEFALGEEAEEPEIRVVDEEGRPLSEEDLAAMEAEDEAQEPKKV